MPSELPYDVLPFLRTYILTCICWCSGPLRAMLILEYISKEPLCGRKTLKHDRTLAWQAWPGSHRIHESMMANSCRNRVYFIVVPTTPRCLESLDAGPPLPGPLSLGLDNFDKTNLSDSSRFQMLV